MRLFPALAAALGVAFLVPRLAAADVSRTPPRIYSEQLATQLTPVEDVLAGRQAFPDSKSGGINLLTEKIVFRESDGLTYRLIHTVYHASDQSGVETIGSDTFTYDWEREEIFLIEAATILPDGQRQPVEAKGTFIQTPQRQANDSLYTSQAELRIVYPNASIGSSTEAIVLIRENIPVMPREFAAIHTYSASWPTYRDRLVLDFPAAELARVRSIATGSGVPEPRVDAYAPGRERRTWERDRLSEIAWEESGPRWEFRGPTLWLTTLASWDLVSAWYAELVAGSSELGVELTAKVDEWTAGLATPREIVDRLTAIVATEVRYVGLEFGLAGYKPHPCREVWEKRYGDCKDKANLLRAMLAHKNIASHLVLLDTRGMGRVERTSPSWLTFNHVILAVETGDAGHLFCDPTVERLSAGTLGLRDLARDVLIVKNGSAEWTQTPDLLASSIQVKADLALGKDGALSGWFSLGGTGSDAAYYASYFHGLDQDDRRRKMQDYVELFIPGSAVMDIDFPPPANAVRETAIRAYLVRPSRSVDEQVVTFPYPADWLPPVTTQGERRFPYTASRRQEAVNITITLPENWMVRTKPAAFAAESEAASFHAGWETSSGKLTARLAWSPKRAVIAPTEYATFQRSVRGLSAWLTQPVVLAPASDVAATATGNGNAGADLHDFPILPTGAGQLRLLDEKYPEGNSEAQRRSALQRVLQWFPQDTETVFTAQVQLALLDQSREGDKAFAARSRALLERYGSQLSAGLRAWAGYLEAKARWVGEQDPEAIRQLQAIADDTSLNAYRRGWSAEAAGRFLRKAHPAEAREFLQRHDDYASEAREAIVRLIAAIYAEQNDAAGLQAWARSVANDHPQVADALLLAAADEIGAEQVATPIRHQLAGSLQIVATDAVAFPRTVERLQQLAVRKNVDDAREAFRAEMAAWLRQHPPAWWTRQKSSDFLDTAALIKSIRDNNDALKPERVVDDVLQLILYHEPSVADFAMYTRWALWWLDHRKFQDDLLAALGQATLKLPADAHEDVIDCWNLLGAYLTRTGQLAEARTIYTRVLETPSAAKYQVTQAGGELGLLELKARDVTAALAAFHRIEPVHTSYKNGTDYLYVAVLLHLERGEYDAALELLTSIQRQEQKYLDASEHHVALQHLLGAARNPEPLKRHWARHTAFRAMWDGVLQAHGLTPAPAHEPPLPTDFTQLNDRLAKAIAAKDAKAYLGGLDQFARLAQWVPLFSVDFITSASRSAPVSAELQLKLYECGLVLVREAEPVEPQFQSSARIWEVALLTDTGKTAEARTRSRAIVKELGVESPAGENVLRIWGIVARGSPEEAEVNTLIAQQLESDRALHDRVSLVRTLSDTYQLAPNPAAHRALLDQESQRSDFDAKSEVGRLLVTRLDLLRASEEAAQAFSRAVAAWREKRGLDWFEHVAPNSLEDQRFSGLKAPVMQAPEGYARAEIIKYNLLAAADERLSIEVRSQALYSAAFDLAYTMEDIGEFTATLVDVAAIKALSVDGRANSLAVAIQTLFRTGQSGLLAQAASSPAFQLLRDEIRTDFERAQRALARAERGGPGWETEAFAILVEKPLERLSVALAERFIRQLAMSGEYDRAEKLVAAAQDMQLDPGLRQSSGALRLEWLRLVRAIRDRGELFTALRRQLQAMPATMKARTPRVLQRFALENTSGLTDDERAALASDFLDRGYLLPEYTRQLLWTLGGARQLAIEHPMCFPDLLEAALRSNAPDAVKSEFVSVAALASDVDQPDVLSRVTQLLNEFARSAAAPSLSQTQQTVALAQAVHALRTSHEPQPPALFDRVRTASLPAAVRTALQLRFHHARGHRTEALQLLETADASSLTQPDVFLVARRVLQDAGRTAEAALLDESMAAILKQRMPDFWLTPEMVTGSNWFDVASALGTPTVFPAAWFERAVQFSGAPSRQHSLRMYQARLREDWIAMAAAADEALHVAPDVYDLYYQRALARHRIGDDTGAQSDLRVFLKYCLSSEDYPDALALLRQLAPNEVAASAAGLNLSDPEI